MKELAIADCTAALKDADEGTGFKKVENYHSMASCDKLGKHPNPYKRKYTTIDRLGRNGNPGTEKHKWVVSIRGKERKRRCRVFRSLNNVMFCNFNSEDLEKVRQVNHAHFFEEEGLKDFLHLHWDIDIEHSRVGEFIANYNGITRTVCLSTGELSIDDELLLEVFCLPSGTYNLPLKKSKAKVVSPHFTTSARGDNGYFIKSCTNKLWQERFLALHQMFSGMSMEFYIPYYFIEFVEAEGKKRNWFDAFRFFFQAEIARIRKIGGTATTQSTIGSHVSLLLAHIQQKKNIMNRLGHGQSSNDDDGAEVHYEAEEYQGCSNGDRRHEEIEAREKQGKNQETKLDKQNEETHQVKVEAEEYQGCSNGDRRHENIEAREQQGQKQETKLDKQNEETRQTKVEAEEYQGCSNGDRRHENIEAQEQQGENQETKIYPFSDKVFGFHRNVNDLLQDLVAGLRKDNVVLMHQVEQLRDLVTDLRKENDVLKHRIEQLQDLETDLRKNNEVLKHQVEQQKSKFVNQVAGLNNQIDSLKTENQSLKFEVEKVRRAREELEERLKSEEILKAARDKQAREDLRERAKDREIWKAERRKGEQARDELNKEIEVVKQENGSLKNELKKAKIHGMQAERAIDELKKENELLKHENGSVNNELEKLKITRMKVEQSRPIKKAKTDCWPKDKIISLDD